MKEGASYSGGTAYLGAVSKKSWSALEWHANKKA